MFSIVALRRAAKVEVLGEDEFWKRFEHYIHPFDLTTDELSTAHGDIDLGLVAKISAVIEPVLGPGGFEGEPWYQNLDFYGDGVRSLEVDATKFKSELIVPLHALLTGEHEEFCVLCKYFRGASPGAPRDLIGALAIFRERILMTQSLVPVIEHA